MQPARTLVLEEVACRDHRRVDRPEVEGVEESQSLAVVSAEPLTIASLAFALATIDEQAHADPPGARGAVAYPRPSPRHVAPDPVGVERLDWRRAACGEVIDLDPHPRRILAQLGAEGAAEYERLLAGVDPRREGSDVDRLGELRDAGLLVVAMPAAHRGEVVVAVAAVVAAIECEERRGRVAARDSWSPSPSSSHEPPDSWPFPSPSSLPARPTK